MTAWRCALGGALTLMLAACPAPTPAPTLDSLAVEPGDLQLAAGRSARIEAVGVYSDGSRSDMTDDVGWISGDETLAQVSADEVFALAEGQVTITATFDLLVASVLLEIGPAEVDSLVPHPLALELAAGGTADLSVTAVLSDGTTAAVDDEVAWSSSDPGVVEVDAGAVVAIGAGEAEILIEHGTVLATVPVAVDELGLVAIDITPTEPLIPLGAEIAFAATGRGTDGSTEDLTTTVEWSSSDVSHLVFDADQPGVAVAIEEGGALVEASLGGTTGETVATVIAADVVALRIEPDVVDMALGLSVDAAAIGVLSDSSEVDLTASAAWSSDDPTVVSARNDAGERGRLVSEGEGEATVRAVVLDLEASASVEVTAPELVELTLSPAGAELPFGSSQAFTATGTWTDGAELDHTADADWSADPSSVLSFAGDPGVGQSTGIGATVVTASFGGLDGSTDLVVVAPELVSIAVTPPNPEAAVGEQIQFAATGTWTDGSASDLTLDVFWASSAPGFLTVDNLGGSEGLATAQAPGLATVLATLGTLSGAAGVTGGPAAPASRDVEPDPATVAAGGQTALTATATMTDGSDEDVTADVLWSSLQPAIATTSNDLGLEGTVFGVTPGGATVTATLGDLSASVTVTVTGAP